MVSIGSGIPSRWAIDPTPSLSSPSFIPLSPHLLEYLTYLPLNLTSQTWDKLGASMDGSSRCAGWEHTEIDAAASLFLSSTRIPTYRKEDHGGCFLGTTR